MTALLQHAPRTSARTYDDLTEAEFDEIGRTLDALREDVLASRGADDAAYVRRLIAVQRCLEVGGRVVLLGSRHRGAWWLGTTALALSKILDNMEIGHNVLHGQWDWMRDPRIHSSTWEWDHASAPEQWKRAHNDRHHVNTNVLGKDNDLGYGIMRVDEAQEWRPRHLVQPLLNLVNAAIFEYGIAMYDLDLGDTLRNKRRFSPEQKREMRTTARRIGRNALRDYALHPLLSAVTGSARTTVTANLVANLSPQRVEPLGDHVRPLPRGRRHVRGGRGGPGGDPRALVRPADARLRRHLRAVADAPALRQPVAPGRAPRLPRPAEQPLRAGRRSGA